jgi:hypothetical protein
MAPSQNSAVSTRLLSEHFFFLDTHTDWDTDTGMDEGSDKDTDMDTDTVKKTCETVH